MASLPSYSFLPWARQGVAAKIQEADTLGTSAGVALVRANLAAGLDLKYNTLDGAEHTATINKQIQITGPGDVLSFDTKVIVRTEPRNSVSNFQSNGLPYIEFYEEDFLWRYTPASAANKASNTSRLRPWLALIALKDEEYEIKQNAGSLPFIVVKQASFDAAFHHQNDTWAFAHVHVNNPLGTLSGDALQIEINKEIKADGDVAVSRLLCPRKLAKNTGYTAFVIPAFETGRLAGLGIKTDGVIAQTPSWKKGAMPASAKRPFDFPVYFQYHFRTAAFGDFESLASILKPIIMDGNSGKMPMDIHAPGFNLASQNDGSRLIGMEASLKPADFVPDKWPTNGGTNAEDINTVDKLKTLLNLSADLVDKAFVIADNNPFFNNKLVEDPMLVPPVYGVWHGLVQKLGGNKNNDPALVWADPLNLDYRNRAAAGLGAKVVQNNQEDFVNRAWQQVNRVNEANKKIEQALLAKMVTDCIFKKHIINAGNDKTIMLTHGIQHLVKGPDNSQTLLKDFKDSRVPFASKTPAFKKIARPNSKVAKASLPVASVMIPTTALVQFNSVIKSFNNPNENSIAALTTAKLKQAPAAALATATITTAFNDAIANYTASDNDMAKDIFVGIIQKKIIAGETILLPAALTTLINNENIASPTIKTAVTDIANNIVNTSFPIKKDSFNQVKIQLNNPKFKSLFGNGVHAKNYNDIILTDDQDLKKVSILNMTTLQDAKDFQKSFTDFSSIVGALPNVVPLPVFNKVESVSAHIFAKIDPVATFAKKFLAGLKIFNGKEYVPLPELKPVMAYPEFEEAVYTYLLQLSKNYILPNIDKLPNNSITLLENNQSFIEAFMVGMNHEMARELLWREYPTDQRGSYFRQFWNIDDNIFPADADAAKNKELKLDIREIPKWSHQLGENNPRGTDASNLVLVIRGDLFKKFPDTMVFAQQAEYASDPVLPRKLKGGGIDSVFTKFPLFKASIEPDITLFGFSLQEDEARGIRIENPHGAVDATKAGWFFVLKERPGHINFGMDDFTNETGDTDIMPAGNPASWNDLAWEYLVNNKGELNNYHITFNKNIVINTNAAAEPLWNSNAADLAAILYQNPVLFARHAAEMLPE